MDLINVESVEQGRKKLLRIWRVNLIRRSEDVVAIWEKVLSDAQEDLRDERWTILEQVVMAAIDVHRPDIVTDVIDALSSNFGRNSLRLRRLEAMQAEMHEDWDLANELLDQILEKDDTNCHARKRLIAIHPARGENDRAKKALNEYLEDFMCDGEAWAELCEIYVLEQEYTKAAFCCEELILQNPHNHLYYQKYADIKYSEGGLDNMDMAKTYYCHTIKLNPNNIRALYGLFLSSTTLASSSKSTVRYKKEYEKTRIWSQEKLTKIYDTNIGPRESCSEASRGTRMLVELANRIDTIPSCLPPS